MLGVWSHPDFQFLRGDVRDALAVAEAVQGMDAIIHLAAIVGDPACAKQPEVARGVNLEGSRPKSDTRGTRKSWFGLVSNPEPQLLEHNEPS